MRLPYFAMEKKRWRLSWNRYFYIYYLELWPLWVAELRCFWLFHYQRWSFGRYTARLGMDTRLQIEDNGGIKNAIKYSGYNNVPNCFGSRNLGLADRKPRIVRWSKPKWRGINNWNRRDWKDKGRWEKLRLFVP